MLYKWSINIQLSLKKKYKKKFVKMLNFNIQLSSKKYTKKKYKKMLYKWLTNTQLIHNYH